MMQRALGRLSILVPALAAVLATGCVGPGIDYGEVVEVEVLESNPGGYRLVAGDQIRVLFEHEPQFNDTTAIMPDGKIFLQHAEDIVAAGRTVAELDEILEAEVGKKLRRPDLTVMVQNYARQKIYVGGEVTRPDEIPLIPGMTVYQAIAATGWFLDSAATDSVVLIRHDPLTGQKRAKKFDFSEESLIAHDVQLQSFDVIYVPKTTIARVNVWVEQHINNILPRGVNIAVLGFTGRRVVF